MGVQTAFATELTLRDEQLVQTPEGRQLLKYIVNCALPADVTLAFKVKDERYVLPGALGLAPGWSTRALTGQEERRVSACVLARTNFFGIPVQLSMRSDAPDMQHALKADGSEQHAFPFFEAAFFGNIFKPRQEMYVCMGDVPGGEYPARQKHLGSLLRVCSLAANGSVAGNLSRCGFVMAGSCNAPIFRQNDIDYSADAIRVYLPAPVVEPATGQ